MSIVIMEEHYQAYFAWKARNIEKAWCWHVDAHLDIGQVGLNEKRLAVVKSCRTKDEAVAADCMGSSYLPWGGLHCGNYLYPAIKEGIVGKLTWVIPPDLLLEEEGLLSWARRHLNEWFELSPLEFRSLEVRDGRVTGTLIGIPFEVGTLEALELPTVPVLLDIDIDYFLEEDGRVWQDSELFFQAVKSVPSLLTTVAYSVQGGYTPESERELARPWLDGEFEQLGEAGYVERPIDKVAALVRCHRYEDALEALEGWDESDIEAGYLKGTSLHALKKFEETLEVWTGLLERAVLPPDGRLYLHNLCAELALSLEKPELCLEHSQKAQKLDRKAYAPCWTEALAREKLGEGVKMIKALRKTVRLSENRIFGLKARNALIRAYRRQGKDGLARIESGKLQQLDPDSRVRGFALMGL